MSFLSPLDTARAPAPQAVALPPSASGFGSGASALNGELRVLRVLLRRWWLIAAVVLLTTSLVYGLLKLRPARYTAGVDILIERDETSFADLQRDSRLPGIDPAEMETHLRVLGSDRLALTVIHQLGLEPRPAESSAWTPLAERTRELLASVLERSGAGEAQAASEGASGPEEQMLGEFRRQLAIRRDPLAHVITVSYTADDPATAAAVANGLAESFLAELVSAKRTTLAQSAEYLRERVDALESELDGFERGAKDFQNESELYQVHGAPAAELRYGELVRELSLAETARNRARARAAQVGSGGQMSEELSTPVMAELRKQEAEVARRIAEYASRFGERHPAMVDGRAELEDIRANLRAERGRIAQEVQTELAVTETQVRDLREQIAATERQLARNAGAQVELKELRTRADTTRSMYTDMLDRYQRATEQQHLLRPPARVISAARPPTQPDSKQALLVLGFTAFGSLAGAMGLALLLDMGRRGFETAEELERETGVPVFGALPLIRRGRRSGRSDNIEAAVFTEAVQRAVARILPPTLPAGGQVVGITSALPDEGKSTIGLAMGRQLASRGRRVLLIHADLHKELPPRFLDDCNGAPHDLVDLLQAPGRVRAEDAVLRDRRTGLHVLAARAPDLDATRLLASPAFSSLLGEARRRYEIVLVDTPPVLAVSDYVVIAGMADQLLFAVRWKATPRRAVRAALREILATGLPLRGLILNQVELQAYRRQAPEDTLGFYRETSRYYRQGRA